MRACRAGPGPGVVMTHGFSATKEMALDRYAEVFEKAGLVVLVYDHRNLGASDGEPRQRINPWAQARDYRRAIDACQAAIPREAAERSAHNISKHRAHDGKGWRLMALITLKTRLETLLQIL